VLRAADVPKRPWTASRENGNPIDTTQESVGRNISNNSSSSSSVKEVGLIALVDDLVDERRIQGRSLLAARVALSDELFEPVHSLP